MKTARLFRIIARVGMGAILIVAMAPVLALAQDGVDPVFGSALGPPVRIASPPNHAVFYAPVDIPIFAYTRSEVRFTNVEIYTNGVDLGPATDLSSTNRAIFGQLASPDVMSTVALGRLQSLWCLVWTNAPAGSYVLTAVARGNELTGEPEPGELLSRTSAPVNITILSSITGANPTNIVNIVATDPIAIAGTNTSWIWPCVTNTVPSWTNWPPPGWAYSTNWGPKAALFTVRRFGDASSDLTVNYNIGGTASNGVDYVALPGYVTVPAGDGDALIPIMPIDNGSNNVPKTVILTLQASTNQPPEYLVGCPRRAEAIILYHWPRPVPLPLAGASPSGGLLPDGSFHYSDIGPDGAWFEVQSSTDLLNWSCVGTNQVFQGSIDYADPNAAANANSYYRYVQLSGPAGQ